MQHERDGRPEIVSYTVEVFIGEILKQAEESLLASHRSDTKDSSTSLHDAPFLRPMTGANKDELHGLTTHAMTP